MSGNYFNTCPICGAHLDPGERCDCLNEDDRERIPQRTNNEEELIALCKNTDDRILEVLKQILEAILGNRKAIEAEKYKDFLVSPSDVAKIINRAGGSTLNVANYGLDALRHYLPYLYRMGMDSESRTLFTVAFLLDAGKIMGIRQERARKKAKRHG